MFKIYIVALVLASSCEIGSCTFLAALKTLLRPTQETGPPALPPYPTYKAFVDPNPPKPPIRASYVPKPFPDYRVSFASPGNGIGTGGIQLLYSNNYMSLPPLNPASLHYSAALPNAPQSANYAYPQQPYSKPTYDYSQINPQSLTPQLDVAIPAGATLDLQLGSAGISVNQDNKNIPIPVGASFGQAQLSSGIEVNINSGSNPFQVNQEDIRQFPESPVSSPLVSINSDDNKNELNVDIQADQLGKTVDSESPSLSFDALTKDFRLVFVPNSNQTVPEVESQSPRSMFSADQAGRQYGPNGAMKTPNVENLGPFYKPQQTIADKPREIVTTETAQKASSPIPESPKEVSVLPTTDETRVVDEAIDEAVNDPPAVETPQRSPAVADPASAAASSGGGFENFLPGAFNNLPGLLSSAMGNQGNPRIPGETTGFSPGNQGFSPGNQGFSPGNQGFSPGNQGFSPGNQGFSPGNQGFASNMPFSGIGFDTPNTFQSAYSPQSYGPMYYQPGYSDLGSMYVPSVMQVDDYGQPEELETMTVLFDPSNQMSISSNQYESSLGVDSNYRPQPDYNNYRIPNGGSHEHKNLHSNTYQRPMHEDNLNTNNYQKLKGDSLKFNSYRRPVNYGDSNILPNAEDSIDVENNYVKTNLKQPDNYKTQHPDENNHYIPYHEEKNTGSSNSYNNKYQNQPQRPVIYVDSQNSYVPANYGRQTASTYIEDIDKIPNYYQPPHLDQPSQAIPKGGFNIYPDQNNQKYLQPISQNANNYRSTAETSEKFDTTNLKMEEFEFQAPSTPDYNFEMVQSTSPQPRFSIEPISYQETYYSQLSEKQGGDKSPSDSDPYNIQYKTPDASPKLSESYAANSQDSQVDYEYKPVLLVGPFYQQTEMPSDYQLSSNYQLPSDYQQAEVPSDYQPPFDYQQPEAPSDYQPPSDYQQPEVASDNQPPSNYQPTNNYGKIENNKETVITNKRVYPGDDDEEFQREFDEDENPDIYPSSYIQVESASAYPIYDNTITPYTILKNEVPVQERYKPVALIGPYGGYGGNDYSETQNIRGKSIDNFQNDNKQSELIGEYDTMQVSSIAPFPRRTPVIRKKPSLDADVSISRVYTQFSISDQHKNTVQKEQWSRPLQSNKEWNKPIQTDHLSTFDHTSPNENFPYSTAFPEKAETFIEPHFETEQSHNEYNPILVAGPFLEPAIEEEFVPVIAEPIHVQNEYNPVLVAGPFVNEKEAENVVRDAIQSDINGKISSNDSYIVHEMNTVTEINENNEYDDLMLPPNSNKTPQKVQDDYEPILIAGPFQLKGDDGSENIASTILMPTSTESPTNFPPKTYDRWYTPSPRRKLTFNSKRKMNEFYPTTYHPSSISDDNIVNNDVTDIPIKRSSSLNVEDLNNDNVYGMRIHPKIPVKTV